MTQNNIKEQDKEFYEKVNDFGKPKKQEKSNDERSRNKNKDRNNE